jgi:4-carboxymuconolactone decarboxylase
MKYSPEYFDDIKKNFPKVAAGFDKLAKDIADAGPLDRKTQLLIKLGVSIGLGIQGHIENITRQALAEGISDEEIRHAALLATTTAGFPSMIVAMQWIRGVMPAKSKRK